MSARRSTRPDERAHPEALRGARLVEDGHVQDGHVRDGHVQDGHVQDGHVENGHVENGHVENGHVENGHVEDGYVENETCPLCRGPAAEGKVLLRLNERQLLRRCATCGLVSNSAYRTDLERIYGDEYFEASSKASEGGYFQYAALEGALNADYRFAYEFIASRLAARPAGARLLDVGCGYGFFLKQFANRPGLERWGLEVSPKAAAAARRALSHVIQAPIEQFVPDRPFDFVVSFEVIEHVFDPRSFLEKLGAATHDDGYLLLTTPNIASTWFRLLGRRWPAIHPDSHNHYFAPETMRRLAETCGLEVVSLRERQILHKTVHQLRKRMGELFPVSRAALGPLSAFDGRTVPFLSGGSMEIVLRKPPKAPRVTDPATA